MVETIVAWFNETLSGVLPAEWIVLIVSMVPVLELRGGMILASLYRFSLVKAFGLCILGNILPVPLILMFVTPLFNWLKKRKLFCGIVERLEAKSMGKSQRIQEYEFWGLLIFVGIPLPGTGAWTGSLIASLLDIDKKKAFLAVVCGVLLASLIMALLSYGIPWLIGLFL